MPPRTVRTYPGRSITVVTIAMGESSRDVCVCMCCAALIEVDFEQGSHQLDVGESSRDVCVCCAALFEADFEPYDSADHPPESNKGHIPAPCFAERRNRE